MNAPPTDLRNLTRSIASNNMRVMNFLEGLIPRVDEVVEATFDRNWSQVGQISGMIARFCELRGFNQIAQSAAAVRDEATGTCNEAELRRYVLGLVSACGQARKEQRAESIG